MIKVARVVITALSVGGMLIGTLLTAAHAQTTNMPLRINEPRGDIVSPNLDRLRKSFNGSSSQGG